MALSRLEGECNIMKKYPPLLCYAEPIDNTLLKWKAILIGPPKSPFEGTSFFLDIEIPQNYPFTSPTFIFKSSIFHPNIR